MSVEHGPLGGGGRAIFHSNPGHGTPTESKSPPNGRASGTVRRSVDGGRSWEATVNLNGADAYSYSCLTSVPQPGFIGLAYETVLPGSAIKKGASANNIVFTLIPQNFSNSSSAHDQAQDQDQGDDQEPRRALKLKFDDAFLSLLAISSTPPPPPPVDLAPWPSHPTWAPTWNMSMSTSMMPCNTSGWFDPHLAAQYGVADFDWSNMRDGNADAAGWTKLNPMDDAGLLNQQIAKVKAINPKTHTWVYRNLVKALAWYKDVGEKLADDRYSGWFLKFRKGGAVDLGNNSYHSPMCTAGVCSSLFHSQDQTPQPAHGHTRHVASSPAGRLQKFSRSSGSGLDSEFNPPHECGADNKAKCDCGKVPCGEYLFDHRNASLREWIVNSHVNSHEDPSRCCESLHVSDLRC